MTGLTERSFDAVIVGGGGAGLRAALQLAQAGKNVALVSKVFPTRSHTVSAQGGITAALGNVTPDHWHWHMFDTVKGSDYLGDQDAIEYMCKVGPEVVYELEHMGLPFSRLDNGKIYQRPFGGQSQNFGKGGQATRTSAAADRTGHALLHTLYQANLAAKTTFFNEWYAIDLVKSIDDNIAGITALCMETGDIVFLRGKVVILATGGSGQIYQSTTNAFINTGDGIGIVARAGYQLQDMEMWQFHPTGIYGAGVLVTEGVRGEGGYLINKDGERFMERYAPNAKDLASRDVVARSMAIEIKEGKGCGDGNYVELKLDHIGADIIKSRLPGIRELAITFADTDPIEKPIPVVPTCHYMMGGIPTNKFGQVLSISKDGKEQTIMGLYAVGECACVSVHGANRLGGNSLLDLVVFGRASGIHAIEQLNQGANDSLATKEAISNGLHRVAHWDKNNGSETVAGLKKELKKTMQDNFGVFRDAKCMAIGIEKLKEIRERLKNATLDDQSNTFNTARIEALELDNLMIVAMATALSANARTESRGAHSREDFPERDDKNWIKHSVYYSDDTLGYRDVNMQPQTTEPFPPKARTY